MSQYLRVTLSGQGGIHCARSSAAAISAVSAYTKDNYIEYCAASDPSDRRPIGYYLPAKHP